MKAGVRRLEDCDDSNGYDVERRKAVSGYGALYLATRARHADAVHHHECAQCGHAPVGSPLNPGHQHARGLRRVAKEMLKDLWVEARAKLDTA